MFGDHAVVLGASMAGLLAARVLADFYRVVTVVERDDLPEAAANRRGVPQGRHAHGLLGRGSLILGELFPGFSDELVAAGVPAFDYRDLSRASFSLGGHRAGAGPRPDADRSQCRPRGPLQSRHSGSRQLS